MIGFRFVDEHQADYRVTDLCRVAGVCRSGFYAWRSREQSARAVANAAVLTEIREIHEQSRRTYASPRVFGQLRRRGHRIGRHRVARLMRRDDLRHTHATLLLQAGVSPKVVSERLGHATVAFTIQVYAHVIPGMQADAAKAFGELVFHEDDARDGDTGDTDAE